MHRYVSFVMSVAALACFAADLVVTGDFDNGRVQVDSIDQVKREIWLNVPMDATDSLIGKDGIFWRARISGITPGELITIHQAVNYEAAMRYVYSYDGRQWFRFIPGGMDTIKHRFVDTAVQICPSIPYSYGNSLELCDSLDANPNVTISNLTMSEEGRPVKMLRITDPAIADAGKRIVWIQGRQHAFESPSCYIVEGFARWLASDDSAARDFRKNIIAYFVPVMDVDNVYHGKTGKNQQPYDMNRVWAQNPPYWNAPEAAKDSLAVLCEGNNRLLCFLDSHCPFYWGGSFWNVVAKQANWDGFKALFPRAETESGGFNKRTLYAEHMDTTSSPTSQIAHEYVSAHWGTAPDYLGFAMESGFYYDANGDALIMIKEGYLKWGEAVGRALYRYAGGTQLPANIPPVAKIRLVRTTTTGLCEFSAVGSYDSSGTIVSYHWDFGDGQTRITTSPTVTHTFATRGYYPVKVRVSDDDGAMSNVSFATAALDSVEGSTAVSLPQAHDARFSIATLPNPFNPSVTISIGIKNIEPLRVMIYDLSGRMVTDLSKNIRNGSCIWDASGFPSGMYHVRAMIGEKAVTKRITLIK